MKKVKSVNEVVAKEIWKKVLSHLSGRRGWDAFAGEVEPEILEEIDEELKALIKKILDKHFKFREA